MGCTRAVGRDSRQEESRVGPEVLGRVGTSWTRPARRMPRMQMNLDIADNHRKKRGISLIDCKVSVSLCRSNKRKIIRRYSVYFDHRGFETCASEFRWVCLCLVGHARVENGSEHNEKGTCYMILY